MKLSVIVPAYNLENYIVECLLSVLHQEVNFPFEVIACDDASTDSTASAIRSLAVDYPQLKTIVKPKNEGLAANMRTLLQSVKGEYIAYLDGDDIALPGKLQAQVNYLDSHPGCEMVFHESDVFDSATGQSLRLYSQSFYNWTYIPTESNIEHLVRYGTYMQASSVMFRNHSNLDNTIARDCKIILDYPFYVLNAGYLNANIHFIGEVLGRYRIHEHSFGAQTQRSVARREQALQDMIMTCQMALQFCKSEEVVQSGISHHQYAAALYFLFKDNDERFHHWITASASGAGFFNKKHKLAWDLRDSPAALKDALRNGVHL
ncbi:glycosyltransferase [Alteromonas pelagimontana]|uniref:Glycosyltransferase n=1 Tax=Alteromonas pelagimontana TaxID=1858656 RepID=A0A6M4MIA6_9ALTE|nr:glycosyltransferase [Alteromonas pelagimontana]QJR81836.1 glycosyltransferase [Alteromonas pelagimontana]